jgi:hypothetical protein
VHASAGEQPLALLALVPVPLLHRHDDPLVADLVLGLAVDTPLARVQLSRSTRWFAMKWNVVV